LQDSGKGTHNEMSSSTVARGPLCRVLLSNGSTTVVPIKSSETIQQLVARLLDKRGLMYSAFEVYTDKHPKVCSFLFYVALITSLVITLFIFCLKSQLVIDPSLVIRVFHIIYFHFSHRIGKRSMTTTDGL
jgi:hypothetical protein